MKFDNRPSLEHITQIQLEEAPEQAKFLGRRFHEAAPNHLAICEAIADAIRTLHTDDEIVTLARDYNWLCVQQLEEELYFRRNKNYRLTTFDEAYRLVYANREYMTRYMNGLLMTQLWWSNHTQVMEYYIDHYLPSLDGGHSHLEIGPGHGLQLFLAARLGRAGHLEGWDISESSVSATKEALAKLGVSQKIDVTCVDLFEAPERQFDSIMFAEILEHMENPAGALDKLHGLLSPTGRLFINMPINSPALDHLFNQPTPEDLRSFVLSRGFRLVDEAFFPATNYSLEQARRKALTINCVFVVAKEQ